MVQWLCVQAPSGYTEQRKDVLQAMVDCKGTQALLPNLQGIRFAMAVLENWMAWSFLLSETSRSIELVTRCMESDHALPQFMQAIPMMAPHVHEFTFHADRNRLILIPFLAVCKSAIHLRRLAVLDDAVDEAVLCALGVLPELTTVRLHLPVPLSLPPLDLFPALKSLELRGCLGSINMMLDHIVSRDLQELTVIWDENDQAVKGDSIRPILNCSRFENVQKLKIFSYNLVYKQDKTTNFTTQFIDYAVLAAFTSCSALSVLEMKVQSVVLTCTDIDALTSNWPGLRRLVLHTYLHKVTLRYLELLGKNCPLIEEVDLHVDINSEANSTVHRPIRYQSFSVRKVRLGGSEGTFVVQPRDVVGLLRRMWPRAEVTCPDDWVQLWHLLDGAQETDVVPSMATPTLVTRTMKALPQRKHR